MLPCFVLYRAHDTVFVCIFEASSQYLALLAGWRKRLLVFHMGVVWDQNTTLPPPVNLWIRHAQDWECVFSVHCLSICLFLTVTFKYLVSLQRHFPEYPALTTARDLCSKQCMPMRVWCLPQTVSHPLHSGVIKPYHSFLYTELHVKSLQECLLWNLNSLNSNRGDFLSAECVYVGVTDLHYSEVCGS